jgi:hypothetical protein
MRFALISTKHQTTFFCFLVISLLISSCSTFVQAAPTVTSVPSTPTLVPPTPPTYSEIISTYPPGIKFSCTDAEVSYISSDGIWVFASGIICSSDKSKIRIAPGGTYPISETKTAYWKSYGVKITVMETVTINKKIYQPGSLLTVDKDLNWIQVSSWK